MRQSLSFLIYLLTGLTGILAFSYPLMFPQQAATTISTPLLTTMLLLLSLGVLLVEVQGQVISAKIIAALGMLVAITAVLRFIEVAIPGPGGFSPIFVPIILSGYVFGSRFGFLMGVMTLLASGLITGYVDPLLPYQMFAAGWVGLTAGWLPQVKRPSTQLAMLAVFSFSWGLLYGAILNLYVWPLMFNGSNATGNPWQRFFAFYLSTSLWWDLGRALGNVGFMLILGTPTIRTLQRFYGPYFVPPNQPHASHSTMKPYQPATRAWITWLAAIALLVMVARNPWYTLILLTITHLIARFCGQQDLGLRLPLGRIGLVILLFSTLFNLLFVHVGDTVLFRLPGNWLLIGGPLTLEAAIYGLGNGLILWTLLTLFNTFNQIVPTSNLIRLTPRAFRDLGVVVLIAITYVPETIAQWQRIRDAQLIRGHKIEGWRDWRPILLPLLVAGMERALGLAESMVARGYGATADARQPFWRQLMLLLSLITALLGWLLLLWQGWVGWILLVSSGLLLIGLIWQMGRQVRYTQYESANWQMGDTLIMLTAVIPLIFWIFPQLTGGTELLTYSPYPALQWPPFSVPFGATLLGFLLPAVIKIIGENKLPRGQITNNTESCRVNTP